MNVGILELLSVVADLPLYGEQSFDSALERHVLWRKFNSFQTGLIDRRLELIKYDMRDLGHVDIDHQNGKVQILPSEICLLPPKDCGTAWLDETARWSGVLCGWRSARLVEHIQEMSRAFGCDVTVSAVSDRESPLLPARVSLSGTRDCLGRLAQEVGIAFRNAPIPHAWLFANESIDITILIQRHFDNPCRVQTLNDLDRSWQVINPTTGQAVTWSSFSGVYGREYALCRYKPYEYKLFRRHQHEWKVSLDHVVGDLAWARWLLLTNTEKGALLTYDQTIGVMRVSLKASLPCELSRAACLCSGSLPSVHGGNLVYNCVPVPIYEVIKQKLCIQ